MPSKKKRPAPLDLNIVHQDVASITLSTNPPKKKRGPYDPEVYHVVEQIRQDVEAKKPIIKRKKREPPLEAMDLLQELEQQANQLDQAIQQMTPLNTPTQAVHKGYQL